jgi:anti-anti-sigma regulatory factor
MPMNVRFERSAVVLSNFGRLMNDPRYFDAARDVQALLDEGWRWFVLDLTTLREIGDVALGLLTTITRRIRQAGGEAVLAGVSRGAGRYLEEMRMEDYWDVFPDVETAARSFGDDSPGLSGSPEAPRELS